MTAVTKISPVVDGAADPHRAGARVGGKLDGFHTLLQLIEVRDPVLEHGATVFGRLDTPGVAIQKLDADGLFQFRGRA
jgi:hypothetical protein